MSAGLLMCVAGAISFGLLACTSKLAERRSSNPAALVIWLCGLASVAMLAQSFAIASPKTLTWPVVAVAIVFGVCGAVAYVAFQRSIEIGNTTVGWLVMNLSAGVPAFVSIWLYSEKLTVQKLIAFGLAALSLLCLFQGSRLEARGRVASPGADS